MPKKKAPKKIVKKAPKVKRVKKTNFEDDDDVEQDEDYEGDVGEEVEEVGAEPSVSKDDEY